jgi:hypothetical protein
MVEVERSGRFVQLQVSSDDKITPRWDLGVSYSYKDFWGHSQQTSSQYVMLSSKGGDSSRFDMTQLEKDGKLEYVRFRIHEDDYKDYWVVHSGGYLWVQESKDYLGGDFGNDGTYDTVKLWTRQGGKHYFKRGEKYDSERGDYYYLVTSPNEAEALVFQLKDFHPR